MIMPMTTTNASQALAAFVRLLLHARAGGQAKVDALLALSQRTLYVPRKLDGSEGFAALVNENGDWALPVFTSLEQLNAAADVFGWRQQDHSVPHDEVGARRAVHYALNEGASYMVIDAIAAHALEASREELKPLVSTQNRSDAFGPYAGVGRISSSILEATRPSDESSASRKSSKPPIAAPRISRPSAEPSFAPPKLPARVTRASFAPPRDDGAPAQRRPTVSFARSSRPPADVEVHLERNAWSPDASLELDRSSVLPVRGTLRPVAELAPLEDLPPLELEGDLPHDTERPRDTDRPPAFPMPPAPDVLGDVPRAAALPSMDDMDDLGLGALQPAGAPQGRRATQPPSAAPAAAAQHAPPETETEPADVVVIQPLTAPADDDLLAACTERLRGFPEVEWATYSMAVFGGRAMPAVGLRVIDNFRTNVDTIIAQLTDAARAHGVALQVLLLDDPELVRSARSLGEVFYPWRRKTRV